MLRDMVDACEPAAISDERAELSATVSVMNVPGRLALQVDENVEQIRTGLEDLRVRGIATLRLDHRRKLAREIDIGLFERFLLDDAETLCPAKSTCTFPESIPSE